MQNLDCQLFFELQVLGGVDRTHAALAKDFEDPIALSQHRPQFQVLTRGGFGGFRGLRGGGFGHGRGPILQQPGAQANWRLRATPNLISRAKNRTSDTHLTRERRPGPSIGDTACDTKSPEPNLARRYTGAHACTNCQGSHRGRRGRRIGGWCDSNATARVRPRAISPQTSHVGGASAPLGTANLPSESETHIVAHEPDAFERLPAVTFHSRNGKHTLTTRLYRLAGQIDEAAAAELDTLLADTRDPKQPKTTPIDRRLLQLLYRTAYHFDTLSIEVTSAFRSPGRRREGLHALGRAIDFAIAGVKAEELASYLRKLPRVGVGIYTHRRTRFVHLDVREQSYHWARCLTAWSHLARHVDWRSQPRGPRRRVSKGGRFARGAAHSAGTSESS